ncbi:hypothetical protein EMCRGX_G023358 [Ephydatia muelleri]
MAATYVSIGILSTDFTVATRFNGPTFLIGTWHVSERYQKPCINKIHQSTITAPSAVIAPEKEQEQPEVSIGSNNKLEDSISNLTQTMITLIGTMKALINALNGAVQALEREDRCKFSEEQNECQQREKAERGLTEDKQKDHRG